MRRGRIFLYLALLLVIGLFVVFFFFQKMMQPTQPVDVAGVPTATPEVQLEDVVVVSQKVGRGQKLDETVLTTVQFPKEQVAGWMFTDVAAAVGRRAKVDLEPEFVLTRNMVTDSPESLSSVGSDAALLIPRGMVSVSIPINRLSSVSYAPQRGDHVNVIVTMMFVDLDPSYQTRLPNESSAVLSQGSTAVIGPQIVSTTSETTQGTAEGSSTSSDSVTGGTVLTGEDLNTLTAQGLSPSGPQGRGEVDPAFEQTFYIVPSEEQRPRLVSQSLLQDVIVLQVGDFPWEDDGKEASPQPTDEPSATDENVSMDPTTEEDAENQQPVEPPKPPDVITLIVSPQDAITLNYLLYSGAQLTLALRGAGDDTRIQTEAVTMQYLLDQYGIPLPVKLPYGMEPRVDDLSLPTLANDVVPTPAP